MQPSSGYKTINALLIPLKSSSLLTVISLAPRSRCTVRSEHHFRAPRPGIKSEHNLSLANMIPLNGANNFYVKCA